MADNDVLYKDQSPAPASFYPESKDMGSGVRRSMFGSADGAQVTLGATTDAEAPSGNGSAIALLKRLRTLLAGTLSVRPVLASSGHISVQTAATGANFTAFASQACAQLTIVNNTGVPIEVQQGGSGVALPVLADAVMPFYGIANANQLSVRRVDQNNAQVTVPARWEG